MVRSLTINGAVSPTISTPRSARAFLAVDVEVDGEARFLESTVRDRAADRMRGFLPDGSDVVRTDGGVAAVIHVPVGEAEHVARILARRMLSLLREPYRLPAGNVRAHASVGIVCVRSDDRGAFTELLGRAQDALATARTRPVEPIAFDGETVMASVGPPIAA
jgi:predicted signal transduction protein with EAL and GGDEF domain